MQTRKTKVLSEYVAVWLKIFKSQKPTLQQKGFPLLENQYTFLYHIDFLKNILLVFIPVRIYKHFSYL